MKFMRSFKKKKKLVLSAFFLEAPQTQSNELRQAKKVTPERKAPWNQVISLFSPARHECQEDSRKPGNESPWVFSWLSTKPGCDMRSSYLGEPGTNCVAILKTSRFLQRFPYWSYSGAKLWTSKVGIAWEEGLLKLGNSNLKQLPEAFARQDLIIDAFKILQWMSYISKK